VGDVDGGNTLSCCSVLLAFVFGEEIRSMNLQSLKASLLVRPWLSVALVALILVTRTNYSSAAIDTPDITLAAFFIAGLWLPSLAIFAVLFVACVAADLLSFAAGVSDWCFTPAYVFLVPTYACMWYAGKLSQGLDLFKASDVAKIALYVVVAIVAAYIISSYSFYYFSGRLTESSALTYTQSLVRYFWTPYFSWAAMYSALALAIAAVVRLANPSVATDARK
jgi:hypothetical protein